MPVPLGSGRQRAVLATLALRAGRVVPAAELVESVWGDDAPPSAAANLRGYVTALRRALGRAGETEPRLLARPGGYLLRARPEEVDLLVFERLAAHGRTALRARDYGTAVARLRRALSCWRGRALADVPLGPRLDTETVRLEESRLAVVEHCLEARLALGDHAAAVPELRGLVAAHPLRERLWFHLMLALYRSGRQADALAAYTRLRAHLAEDLGLAPSPELRRLEHAILRADPALDLRSTPSAHRPRCLRPRPRPRPRPR
ncbi:AfsR/SARP family transcriptional regulator [Bailinhaonella thermotolerans]|nr:AfsR/SARP family transcriptional regulator [Bailinhaonella thermotolerans]